MVEYYPSGFFEKTGNIWRAQGRRLRLDLKHFMRYVTLSDDEDLEGWRGEIRDGEVVRSHEEGLEDDAEEDEPEEGEVDDGDARYEEGRKTETKRKTRTKRTGNRQAQPDRRDSPAPPHVTRGEVGPPGGR